MEVHRGDTGGVRRPRLVGAITIALLLFPASLAVGEDLDVEMVFRNNPVGVRDTVYLSLYVGHPRADEVTVASPTLPDAVTILSGPSIRPYAVENSPDSVRISYTLRATKTGMFVIPPFSVTAADRSTATSPVILEVGLYANREVYIPLDASWQLQQTEIAVGQAVPVILVLNDLKEIPLIRKHSVRSPKGALFDEAPGLGAIQETPVGDQVLYTVPVASYMITPSQSGSLVLPSASVSALGLVADTGNLQIDVLSLPESVGDSGAIGDLRLTAWLDSSQVRQGQEVNLTVRVSGVGNLNFLRMPSPDFGGGVLLETLEDAELTPDNAGYRGWREDSYRFVAENPRIAEVTVSQFVWLDAASGRVRRSGPIRLSLSVAGDEVEALAGEIQEAPVESRFPVMPARAVLAMPPRQAYADPLHYLWLLPLPIAFIVLLALKRSGVLLLVSVLLLLAVDAGGPEEQKLEAAVAAFESGDYEVAADYFHLARPALEGYAGLYYNIALTEYRLGNLSRAINAARTAVAVRPMNSRLRSLTSWLNEQTELEDMVSPALRVHPDLPFYALMIGVALAFACLILLLLKQRGWLVIAFVLSGFLALASGGGLLYTIRKNAQPTAIVQVAEAGVRKIPRTEASVWFTFREGQSIRVLDETGPFYLVETAFGLKAWIERDYLLFDGKIPPRGS